MAVEAAWATTACPFEAQIRKLSRTGQALREFSDGRRVALNGTGRHCQSTKCAKFGTPSFARCAFAKYDHFGKWAIALRGNSRNTGARCERNTRLPFVSFQPHSRIANTFACNICCTINISNRDSTKTAVVHAWHSNPGISEAAPFLEYRPQIYPTRRRRVLVTFSEYVTSPAISSSCIENGNKNGKSTL